MDKNIIERDVEQKALMLEMTMNCVVAFRRIYLPSNDECEPAPFHYEWGDILMNGRSNFAIEAFREAGKSTILLAFAYQCLKFPRTELDYIIFVCKTKTKASEKILEIADGYINNPLLNKNFERIVRKNENFVEIEVRDIYGEVLNIRLGAAGRDSSVRGSLSKDRRPKLVILDDIQDLEDANSPRTCVKDWDWFVRDICFLGKEMRIFMIGNNLGEKCLIEQVFQKGKYYNFKTKKIGILDEEGNPTWPSRYPKEYIEHERRNMEAAGDIDKWFSERMCEPMSPENKIFKEEMLTRTYDVSKINIKDLNIFTTCDFAISQKDTADYTAIVTVGVNSDNHWFILDVRHGRFDPSQTMDHLFEVVSLYRPRCVGIEKIAFQASMEHFIEKEMPKRKVFFELKELKSSNKKEERIKMLHPRFKTKTVWFPDYVEDWLDAFKAEFLAFPFGKHDDILDALAYIEQIAQVPTRKSSYTNKKNYKPIYAGSM